MGKDSQFYFTKSQQEVEDFARKYYGHSRMEITKADIEKLQQGYIMYFTDGEYTYQFNYKE